MPTRKMWDHAIDLKKGFVSRKEKVYSGADKDKVTTDYTGILYEEKEWEKNNGIRLLVS